jgi:hypothetical protein
MATTVYKVLGQTAPSTAATAVTLYTVPSSTQAVLSTLTVANRGSSTALYRIAVRPAGAALANQHYICYDTPLPPYDSAMFTIGMTLAATDVVTVQASNTNVTFGVFGSEIS